MMFQGHNNHNSDAHFSIRFYSDLHSILKKASHRTMRNESLHLTVPEKTKALRPLQNIPAKPKSEEGRKQAWKREER
jgi:hypothetical protein